MHAVQRPLLAHLAINPALGAALVLVAIGFPAFPQWPGGRDPARALNDALAAGQKEQAEQATEQILARPRVDLEVLLETGAKLAGREWFAPSRAVFTRAVNDYPRSFEARYNLALADFALQRLSEAQDVLNGAQRLTREQQLAREYLRGRIYDALGQNLLAERCLDTAFRGAPNQENYALDLGLFYLRKKAYVKAMATLEAATRHHPDSIYMALGLGLAQIFGDDPARAIATCRRILSQEPDFELARLMLAAAYYLNGENENCLKEAAAVISRPGAPPYLYYLNAASMLKMNSKDYATILRDLNVANKGIPGCAFCYFAQSKVHQEMGDEAAAIADLEILVGQLDPGFSQGWYRLSGLYHHVGRHADAAKALDRFRALKTAETDRETEYLRKLFLQALPSR
jgi:tetratricopeptide (TPR) repeat protein